MKKSNQITNESNVCITYNLYILSLNFTIQYEKLTIYNSYDEPSNYNGSQGFGKCKHCPTYND